MLFLSSTNISGISNCYNSLNLSGPSDLGVVVQRHTTSLGSRQTWGVLIFVHLNWLQWWKRSTCGTSCDASRVPSPLQHIHAATVLMSAREWSRLRKASSRPQVGTPAASPGALHGPRLLHVGGTFEVDSLSR